MLFNLDVANSPSPITYQLSSFAREPPDGVEKIITVAEEHKYATLLFNFGICNCTLQLD